MPLSATADGLFLHSLSQWRLDATTGQWKVGRGSNYLLDPEFAADRVPVTRPAGWITTIDSGFSANSCVAHPNSWPSR